MEIKINCKGSRYMPYEQFEAFQGDLKTLTKERAEKLANSIKKHGWIAPVFIWGDKILDGHARLKVLQQLLSEGNTIGKIPVVDIQATSERDAAEKLLVITSSYQKITEDGLFTFLTGYDLKAEALGDVEFFDIDMDAFKEDYLAGMFSVGEIGEVTEFTEDTNFIIKCASLTELEELQELIGTKAGKKISYEKFKDLMAGRFPVRVPKVKKGGASTSKSVRESLLKRRKK